MKLGVIYMKKIGILSMQRVVNYGSFLQAYGLKKTIESLGYKVEFVDYEFEKSLISTKKQSFTEKILNNYNIVKYLKKKKHIKNFREMYSKYLNDYLEVKNQKNYYPNIDTLVIGSDEVFNCLQNYPVGYSRNLFGYGYEDKNVISYAASFGHTKIEELIEYGIDKEISNLLKKFKSISVRDNNSYSIVKKLTNSAPLIHLDPVLISDFNDEIKNIKINYNNYIIVYAYSGRLTKQEEKAIKKFAKDNDKIIISLGFYQKIADYNLIVNPFEVLAYIKKADYVITDTFHGSIFSVKMNTKFCTIVRNNNFNKLNDLLNRLGHEKQIINKIDDIQNIFDKEISFEKSNRILLKERKKTISYLKENI